MRATPQRRAVQRSRWRRIVPAIVTTGILITGLTACGHTSASGASGQQPNGSAQSTGLTSGLGSLAKDRTIIFLEPGVASDPFWATISQGAKDAAQLFNIKLDLRAITATNGDDNAYNDMIGTAVASHPAGLAVGLNDPNRYTTNVCAAQKAGIKVISYNQTQTGAIGKCLEGFVGQNFVDAGQILGTRLVTDAKLGKGDLVFAPVEVPTAVYAIQRLQGVQKALSTVGARAEGLATMGEDSNALSLMTSWLLAHKGTVKAVATLGGTPSRNIVKAMSDSGVKVPVVAFDLSPTVITDIKNGSILAAADQQGYVQGFQAVAELAMQLDFGLSPATINSGGNALIDKTNVQFASDLAGKVR